MESSFLIRLYERKSVLKISIEVQFFLNMLENLNLQNILFLDVECVSAKPKFKDLSPDFQALWGLKAKNLLRKQTDHPTEEEIIQLYPERAAIYAEFGKIICISVGFIFRRPNKEDYAIRLKSFADDDEKVVLTQFAELLDQYYNNTGKHMLCGHNIKEFDVPYICRRMVTNQMALPNLLHIPGKKPWELNYLIDTMELWKFGDYKAYSSLNLLSAVLDFPTPKDDIDGSQVGRVYWEEKELSRIAHYCEKDVLATANCLMRYMRRPIFEGDQAVHV